eukprot:CAMPEP_0114552926 /NCGR_PEP_ID=MMETSP0114-20121206/7382_1 /TAXON_ID=31324 /ORGANISM="Goniomonas sp, Strain m" /LENGTH=372 /DNA_ID=CAMNT_0001737829 /DNA_START=7 /DNA_END=1125 /DNA_ORIENTATION=-
MKVGILGSGAVGSYIGGALQYKAAADVIFVGRTAFSTEIENNKGMSLSSLHDEKVLLPAHLVRIASLAALGSCDYVIVTVKTDQTKMAALSLARVLKNLNTVVVSLQNAANQNTDILKAVLPQHTVLAGTVRFNVVREGAWYHRSTEGALYLEEKNGVEFELVEALLKIGSFPVITAPDIKQVSHNKLLMNFLNPINALAGVPAREMLMDPLYRHIWATAVEEALAAFKAGSAQLAVLREDSPVWMSLLVIRLPTRKFIRSFKPLETLSDETKLPMLLDLDSGRCETDVDQILGPAILQGKKHNCPTPTLDALSRLMHQAEQAGSSPHISSKDLAVVCGISLPRDSLPLSLRAVALTGVVAGATLLMQRMMM